jgi:cytochrome c nitrite reductase small subunit
MTWQPQRGNISIAGLVLCTLIGLLLGTSAFTFHYAQGTSYLSNDPAACVNCHIMRPQYDSWQKSSHHAVATCNDCHVPHDVLGKWLTKADNGFWHSYYFTFQNFHEPIQLRPVSKDVLQHNCLYCHKPFVNEILGHPRGFADAPTDCIRCHHTVGHGGR